MMDVYFEFNFGVISLGNHDSGILRLCDYNLWKSMMDLFRMIHRRPSSANIEVIGIM